MSFKKDGEIKVYKTKKDGVSKNASDKEADRYTVDDLVKEEENKKEEETEDVPDKTSF